MIGKKKLLIFMVYLLAGFTACNTVSNVSSIYRDKPLMIDGKLDEWKQDVNYDRSSKLHYSVTHDDENIYVGLMVKDDMVQRKILMFGMTLWIDTTGSKEKLKGVRYPIPSEERQEVQMRSESGRDLPERARRALPDNDRRVIKPALLNKMTLLGFNDIEEETVSIAEQSGINVRMQKQDMIGLTYEAKIPFDMLYSGGSPKGKDLSLGIITGHLDLPDRRSGLMSPGGMSPGGGMYPGSGRGGQMGGMGSGPGNLEELQKSTKLWLKRIDFENENP